MRKKAITVLTAVMVFGITTGCGGGDEARAKSEAKQQAVQGTSDIISEDEAAEIAFQDAGVSLKETDQYHVVLTTDDGVQQYEVEFYVGNKGYEYEIDAVTGDIRSKDFDIEDAIGQGGRPENMITEEQARGIVLERVPGADDSNLLMNIEEDDGKWSYEGTIIYEGKKYECSVDAVSGDIIAWEDETYDD